MPPFLHSLLTFSPFAFASLDLERAYHKFQTAYVISSAWSVFSLTVLGWASVAAVVHLISLADVGEVLNPAIFPVPIISALAMLAVLRWRPTTYQGYWQALHALQQVIHGMVSVAVWKEMVRSYAEVGLRPKSGPWFLHFLREFLIEQPWWFQAVLVFCLQLYIVPQHAVLGVQLVVHLSQIPWYCSGPPSYPHLITRFPELGSLVRLASWATRGALLPRWGGAADHSAGWDHGALGHDMFLSAPHGSHGIYSWDHAACAAHMAFWQVQSLILTIVLTLVRELCLRRSFLRTNARLTMHARRQAAKWPFHDGGSQILNICAGLTVILVLLDTALLRLATHIGFALQDTGSANAHLRGQ